MNSKRALRLICPQALLNWREAHFYGKYGEVELHLLEDLCRRDQDSIDVGANDGSYVHFLRACSRRVHAYEPMPALARALRKKFRRGVMVHAIALSRDAGTAELHMPVVNGVMVTGCSTISSQAAAAYSDHNKVSVPVERLDDIYNGQAGLIKVDVEGHEQAVLDGAVNTIRRCRPRMLVEIDERLSPGGLARARAFFEGLGYSGYYVHARRVLPIREFSLSRLQDPVNLPSLKAPLQQRERFGRYIYNFIFLPSEDIGDVLPKITETIASL